MGLLSHVPDQVARLGRPREACVDPDHPGFTRGLAPGQICCQALTGFARVDGMDEQQVENVAQNV